MVGMDTAYIAYDYGTGAATTGPRIYSNCGTTTSAIEYGYADATSTCATGGRILVPTIRKVRNTSTSWITNSATSCSGDWGWEVAEDECGIRWEGYGASNTVLKVVKWTSYGDVMKSYPKLTPEQMAALDKKRREDRIRQIMQGRCAPNAIVRNSKRQPMEMPTDIREQRARETLRRVIGDDKFTNFIKHGFVSVRGKSGLVYQIFTGHGITHVFNQGNLVERLCVVLQGNFPPTDSLIMRYLLILNNEQQFRSFAVKHSVEGYQTGRSHQQNGQAALMKPLAEIFKELKAA